MGRIKDFVIAAFDEGSQACQKGADRKAPYEDSTLQEAWFRGYDVTEREILDQMADQEAAYISYENGMRW